MESVRHLIDGAADREAAPVWFLQARDDLEVARDMLERRKLHLVLFFSHEAIEKALIGYLISQGDTRVGTHSIFTLARRAAEKDQRFANIGSDGWTLDTLYIFSRYPFGTPFKAPKDFFTDERDASEALRVAQEVLELACESSEHAT
jgi:HEPN domain-containing protein